MEGRLGRLSCLLFSFRWGDGDDDKHQSEDHERVPPVSPSVVAAILISQNVRVTSGTLLFMLFAERVGICFG